MWRTPPLQSSQVSKAVGCAWLLLHSLSFVAVRTTLALHANEGKCPGASWITRPFLTRCVNLLRCVVEGGVLWWEGVSSGGREYPLFEGIVLFLEGVCFGGTEYRLVGGSSCCMDRQEPPCGHKEVPACPQGGSCLVRTHRSLRLNGVQVKPLLPSCLGPCGLCAGKRCPLDVITATQGSTKFHAVLNVGWGGHLTYTPTPLRPSTP